MTPSDLTKDSKQMERIYKEVLRVYKIQIDDMQTQEADLTRELNDYTQKVGLIREENETTFGGFVDREREVAVDLIFEKTGKKMTEKLTNALIHRQVSLCSQYRSISTFVVNYFNPTRSILELFHARWHAPKS